MDNGVLDAIVAALQSGDLSGAEHRCRSALEHAPDEPDLLLLLGFGLQRQGRAVEAVPVYHRLTELYPDDSMHWGNYVTALKFAGDLVGAEQAAQTGVRHVPEDPKWMERLGLLQLHNGKLAEGQALLMRAHELAPDSISIRLSAARACVACHDQHSEDLLRPWREWLPLADAQQAEVADLLVLVGEVAGAIELLEDLVKRAPAVLPVQLLLAKVYERMNRLDQAQAKLQWVVENSPSGNADISREVKVQQAQLAMRRREYSAARALLEEAGPANDADDSHWFALAKACDRLGDPDSAMQALATAHALQTEQLRSFNPHLLEADAPPLPHVDDRVGGDDYRAWPALKAPDASQSPVFVVGFPRSGTTLLEQMLDAHPRLQSMDERPFLNRLARQLENINVDVPRDLRRLDQRDCDELRKGYLLMACGKVTRNWDTRLVDKNPLNMLWLPMIQRMFPRAKFILALRHPCDVILSCYLQNFRAAALIAACRSLETLARAYVAAMENWSYHAARFQPDVFISRYEDLVADPVAQTGKIAAFLELGEAGSMLHFAERARAKGYIATPSYTQVVEPISTRGLGHCQQYALYFEPVLPILQPMLDHWGYAGAAALRSVA